MLSEICKISKGKQINGEFLSEKGKPYVLLKSCQFEWDKNDDRRFNLDDPSIVEIGGYISPIELTLTVVPKKSGKTTLTITNKQLDIRGAVENVFVRKVVLYVP